MRKVLLALVASAAMLTAGHAWATPEVAPHQVIKELQFRSHRAAMSGVRSADETGTVYADSAVATNAGAGITAIADTTVSFSTLTTQPPLTTYGALTDTAGFFFGRLCVSDAGSGTGTYDSLYVVVQVSADNRQWSWAATAVNTTPSITVWDNTGVIAMAKLNNANQWSYSFHTLGTAGRVLPDILSLNSWPFIRFIIYPDVVGRTTAITSLKAEWVYESSDANVGGFR